MTSKTIMVICSILRKEEEKADKEYQASKKKIQKYRELQGYSDWETDDTLRALKEEHSKIVDRCNEITDALADFVNHEWK